ncbi:MAG: ribonuclease HII [Mogibacterium sp.]|nr:ribonuclease HII [Mogibacterium sp.]
MTKQERLERDIAKLAEMKAHEDELRAAGYRYIAGIDEVGRGPLAGPVYAACVILPDDFDVPGINDSKKLSAKRREELADIIKERAIAWGLGIADNNEIDELNILEATKTAMKRAIAAVRNMLSERGLLASEGETHAQDMLLIDAVKLDAGMPSESIIKGDEKCLCIAAASIVAKVARDSFMTEMDSVYPGYDFAGNKGYGTAKHYEGLRTLGKTPIHRKTFLKKFDENPETGHKTAKKEECGREAAKMAKKVYAVRKGRTTGLFMSWDDCKAQVDGFAGAEYKSFADPSEAMAYLGIADGSDAAADKFPEGVRAYVDGSYDSSSSRFSCGVVIVETDADGISETTELNAAFDDAEAAQQRNVAGEIMGSKLAIEHCIANGMKAVEIYHDYEGIGAWADRKWKANNPLTQGYRDYVAEARKNIDIRFVKVKAHAGNKYNELADRLAKKALSE